jgi:hypothetical protein
VGLGAVGLTGCFYVGPVNDGSQWFLQESLGFVNRTEPAHDQIRARLARWVDPAWYLEVYPDVAAAGLDPLEHYCRHGRFEGRLPSALLAEQFAEALWENGAPAEAALERLVRDPTIRACERCHAAWSLARWHAAHGRWSATDRALERLLSEPDGPLVVPHAGPALLRVHCLIQQGLTNEARAIIDQEKRTRGDQPDLALLELAMLTGKAALAPLNRVYRRHSLRQLRLRRPSAPLSMENLASARARGERLRQWRYGRQIRCLKVSVLVPARNSERTLETALESLRYQTWSNIEVIVVDDASTDNTGCIAQTYTILDPRFQLIRRETSQGAYVARNTALATSSGDFVTVHDSDDWSHPQKIELQVLALVGEPSIQGCVTHWARMTPDLKPLPGRLQSCLVHRNISSLMFRRSVFHKLGYWDRVLVSADTEYLYRIERAFPAPAIQDVLSGVPLSFGRHRPEALTERPETHWTTSISGVRRAYLEAARAWHAEAACMGDLYIDESPPARPFPAPQGICP